MSRQLLKVLSYNIHKGFTANQKFVLTDMREAMRKTGAELIFLQEVLGHHDEPDRKIKSWPTTAQFEFLADSMWHHYAYGKNAIYTEGHHGNAILSKYPIMHWSNFDISNNRLEKRGLLHAVLDVAGRHVHAACLHLDLLESSRRVQIDRVCQWVRAHIPAGEPLILAGDFNDWKQKASMRLKECLALEEVFCVLDGKHAKTFPSFFPTLRLDRIYYRHSHPIAGLRLRGYPWQRLSDHIPLYAELNV